MTTYIPAGAGYNPTVYSASTTVASYPNNMTSTVYPCGHTVSYYGSVPPGHCVTCGTAHQWVQQGLIDAAGPIGSPGTYPNFNSQQLGMPKTVTTPPAKELTPREWLDAEIDSVRKLAWAA